MVESVVVVDDAVVVVLDTVLVTDVRMAVVEVLVSGVAVAVVVDLVIVVEVTVRVIEVPVPVLVVTLAVVELTVDMVTVVPVIEVVDDVDVDCASVFEVAVVRQSSLASRTYKVFLVDPVDLLSSSLYRLHRTVPLLYMNALQPPSVYSRHLSAHASKQLRHSAGHVSRATVPWIEESAQFSFVKKESQVSGSGSPLHASTRSSNLAAFWFNQFVLILDPSALVLPKRKAVQRAARTSLGGGRGGCCGGWCNGRTSCGRLTECSLRVGGC